MLQMEVVELALTERHEYLDDLKKQKEILSLKIEEVEQDIEELMDRLYNDY